MKENITQEMIDKWNKKLRYCIENQKLLGEWEVEFISSIYKYLEKHGKISIRQSFKLNEIYKAL